MSGSVLPTIMSTRISRRYVTKPTSQIARFRKSKPRLLLSRLRMKKSAICIAIIGANTEPMK